MVIPLKHIRVGETAQIVWIASDGSMAQRLMDLGFVPGEDIQCVLSGKKHGMQAYLIRHAVIALRQCTANEILVRTAPDD